MDKLRIFYASDNTPNSELDSSIWRLNLFCSLQDLGHEIVEFDYDLREIFRNLDFTDPIQNQFIQQHKAKTSQVLLEQIRFEHSKKPINFFFSYFYDACVTPETIDEIRSMGIKTINWYCNASYQLHLVAEISPHYDFCLVPEKFRLADYKAIGANPVYFQEAANPRIYKPYSVPYEYDVSFVGQKYGNRAEFIHFLNQHSVNVRVWGTGWLPKPVDAKNAVSTWVKLREVLKTRDGIKKITSKLKRMITSSRYRLPHQICGNPLSDQEMVEMFNRSKINLGFSVVGETYSTTDPIKQIRLRDFEIPMSGGFYMTEYFPELEDFYEIGKEIVCFTDKADLLHKVIYYLEHPDEREQIRWAGFKRAQKYHSWQKRFADLFDMISGKEMADEKTL